jgi:hypothetical protein
MKRWRLLVTVVLVLASSAALAVGETWSKGLAENQIVRRRFVSNAYG